MAVQLFTISESDWKSGLSTVKTTGKTVLAGLTSLFSEVVGRSAHQALPGPAPAVLP